MAILWKDLFRQIKNTPGRFISILLIVALGVAFYSGIRSSESDMRISLDKMYDEENIMDLYALSAQGITDEDIKSILDTEGVKNAVGTYSVDSSAKCGGEDMTAKFIEYSGKINVARIEKGKVIENDDECLIDSNYADDEGINIGDVVTVTNHSLCKNNYKIVGFFTRADYLSYSKGANSVGTGSTDALVMIKKEQFNDQAYTGAYITVDDAKELQTYSDAYDELVREVSDRLEAKKIAGGTLTVLDRESIESYVQYDQDAERIGKIGTVFPIVFFIVAALVSLTTMTRMVEEERVQIGTKKALGYKRTDMVFKYMAYGVSATIIGGIAGGIIGSKAIPYVIISAYKILYRNLYIIFLPINMLHFLTAVIVSFVCVAVAILISCYGALGSCPANLMVPESPKAGKRVFAERIPIFWNHLNFNMKSTFRNLFRYKKRLFMTLFGIGGCMALLLVGFGLKNSINSIVDIQYGEIFHYDATVNYNPYYAQNGISYNLAVEFKGNSKLDGFIETYQTQKDVGNKEKTISTYIVVPKSDEEFADFITLRNRKTNEEYTLDENDVVITEKLANELGVSTGDSVYLNDNDKDIELTVSAIAENYIYHYLYMSKDTYERVYGGEFAQNSALLKFKARGDDSDEISKTLMDNEKISSVSLADSAYDTLRKMIEGLNAIVYVIVVGAAALAFVVLYNLNQVNIAERQRELSTLKVLGFYDTEVSAYIYRENIIITIIGMIIGIAGGIFLHHYVVVTAEIDIAMFGRDIGILGYVLSAVFTILFAGIVNWIMYFKIKKINMAESLKSGE